MTMLESQMEQDETFWSCSPAAHTVTSCGDYFDPFFTTNASGSEVWVSDYQTCAVSIGGMVQQGHGGPAKRQAYCPEGYVWYATGFTCVADSTKPKKNRGKSCPAIWDPINPATGNVFEKEDDIPAKTNTQLSFSRFYNSLASDASIGNLDAGWIHNFEEKLLSFNDGAVLVIVRRDGKQFEFSWNGSSYVADADVNDRLIKRLDANGILSGWLYYDSDGYIDQFDSAGRLLVHTRVDGYQQALSYSGTDYVAVLNTVTDSMGHTAVLSYQPASNAAPPLGSVPHQLLAGVTINNAYGLTYSSANGAVKITYADGSAKLHTHFVNGKYNSLSSTVDELGQIYGQHGYDSTSGKALSAQTAPQIGGGTISYSADGTAATAVDVNGRSSLYTLGVYQGVVRVDSQSQPPGSGCGAATSASVRDVNGNLASSDDFNGNRTCRAFDSTRNLENSSVSGLSNTTSCSAVTSVGASLPVGSTKTNTQWHPDWRLAVAKSEPGRLTTFVYNGQPNPLNGGVIEHCAPSTALLPDGKPIVVMCKQIEQATTDANGSQGFAAVLRADVPARQTSWTYNQFGQMLTSTDPLGRVTSYAYYASTSSSATQGDLQSITNAVGQITTFNQYNAAGQVLQSTDANGVITKNTYDQRLRLLSSTTGSEVTSFAYDLAGQLLSVTAPNGSVVTYSYDAAHRLVQVTDGAGNQVVYTLDASGNRVGEQVKDVNGAISRNITRSFDALGRLQQVIGAPQ
ncbi:DUF6531 domain-containing protein [Roseateles sp. BYS78W]|uniref:DUF6531 domain-containing protein n=1 Tax=Pelomonas candidula TaxID=3299025 RepID=A0ABW7HJG3_9BURK